MEPFPELNRYADLQRHLTYNDDLIIISLKAATRTTISIIKSIITYARCLLKQDSTVIDEIVFRAQMSDRFNIKNVDIVSRIYSAACNSTIQSLSIPRRTVGRTCQIKKSALHLHNYCYLICIFMSNDLDVKVDFIFDVFDDQQTGKITMGELSRHVGQSIEFFDVDDHDVRNENLQDIVNLLMTKFDQNQDNKIDRREFHDILTLDELMMDCLGKVFPDRQSCDNFKDLLRNKLPLEIRGYFRFELRRARRSLWYHKDIFAELYPIKLDPWLPM